MRVLQMIDSLAPGGAERSLAELVPHLVSLGVDIEFALLHGGPGLADEVRSAGAEVSVLDGTGRPAWLAAAVRRIRSQRYDLVSTTLFDADIVGRVAARLSGVPCVSTLVNTPYGAEHGGESGVRRSRLLAARAADMATAPLARRFRAVSEAVKDAYVDRLHIRSDLVDVIPEGRNPARLGTREPQRRAAARQSLGVEDDETVILAIGRQDPQKGFDVLLRAEPLLAEIVPRHRVFIAGRAGRSTDDLVRLAEKLRVDDRVTFLGHRSDVADLLCGADLFALPSVREGIPGVVQEAMALECPVVASDIGPVREAVGSSECAELFRPGDPTALSEAVRHVLAAPDLTRRRVAQARRRFLEEFDAAAVARRVVAFYEVALGTDRAGRPRR